MPTMQVELHLHHHPYGHERAIRMPSSAGFKICIEKRKGFKKVMAGLGGD